ncbi:MAG: hypothetical protein ACFFE8_01340 [Candidatus Heimdallarchaeota archaeon]
MTYSYFELASVLKQLLGWTSEQAQEGARLIDELTPDEVLASLKAVSKLQTSKPTVGRPKSYALAWILLQNNLVTLEEFETLVHRQLVDQEIKRDTFYRAMRNARKFISQRDQLRRESEKLTSYESIWISFQANRLSPEQFKLKMLELYNNGVIAEEKYRHALVEIEKIIAIQKRMIEHQIEEIRKK